MALGLLLVLALAVGLPTEAANNISSFIISTGSKCDNPIVIRYHQRCDRARPCHADRNGTDSVEEKCGAMPTSASGGLLVTFHLKSDCSDEMEFGEWQKLAVCDHAPGSHHSVEVVKVNASSAAIEQFNSTTCSGMPEHKFDVSIGCHESGRGHGRLYEKASFT